MSSSGLLINSLPELTSKDLSTAVIVDAMYFIRRLSFQKDEKYATIADSYRRYLLTDIPLEHKSFTSVVTIIRFPVPKQIRDNIGQRNYDHK